MNQELKGAIEALLFLSERPLTLEQLREITDELDNQGLRSIIDELQKEYNASQRGIYIEEVAGGFRMITNPRYARYLKKFYKSRMTTRLTAASLETLAIIAYKQPVTRMEIESIRGVNVEGVLKHLLNLGLIRTAGRKEALGRPLVYSTSRQFLEHFGLNSLKDLPRVEELKTAELSMNQGEVSDEPEKITSED